jgi:hypothetical protein
MENERIAAMIKVAIRQARPSSGILLPRIRPEG